ncbi:MAG: TetR/AcrR family transcriptional regulator [Acidimicrobiales bacterium]
MTLPVSSDVRTRLLEGAYQCIAERGLAATSLEDAATAAGVSRATLYRYFPGGREELIGAVITYETLKFFQTLAEAVSSAPGLESLLVDGISFAHSAVEGHAVLQKILETEPERLLPQLSLESARLVGLIAAFFEARFADHDLAQGVDRREAAEYVARLSLSFIGSPGGWDLSDREQVGELVRSEFLAGLLPY